MLCYFYFLSDIFMLIVDAERMSYIHNRSKDPRGSTRSYIDKSTRGIAKLNF